MRISDWSSDVCSSDLDTKRYVAGGYLISNQLQGAVASMLAGNWLVGLPPEYLGEYVPKIRAVNAAQVQAMARKYYDPENQSIVVVGDAAAVAEQLKPYGEFEVRERSEEHTSELQSLMRLSYAVFCLQKKKTK